MYYEMLISLKSCKSYYLNFEILIDAKWNHYGGTLKNDHFQALEGFFFLSRNLFVKFLK